MNLSMGAAKPAVSTKPKVSILTDKNIVEVDIGTIKEWKDNPRKNDQAVPKLAKILRERGQVHPIVVWRKNNVCYAGNTRLKAAKHLKWKTIKVLFVDFPSEQTAVAFGIADNKSSEWSEWDDDLLTKFLNIEDLGEVGFSNAEKKFMNLTVDKEFVESIKANQSDIQSRIVIVACSASIKIKVREMLIKFLTVNNLIDKVEIK